MSITITVITASDFIEPVDDLLQETKTIVAAELVNARSRIVADKVSVNTTRAGADQISTLHALVVVSASDRTIGDSLRIKLQTAINGRLKLAYPDLRINTLMTRNLDKEHRQLVRKIEKLAS